MFGILSCFWRSIPGCSQFPNVPPGLFFDWPRMFGSLLFIFVFRFFCSFVCCQYLLISRRSLFLNVPPDLFLLIKGCSVLGSVCLFVNIFGA